MNVTILTFGSRGDVQPYLALACGLKDAGHRAKIVVPASYADWVHSYGIDSHPQRFDFGEYVRKIRNEPKSGSRNPVARFRSFREAIIKGSADSLEDFRAACDDADFVLQSGVANGAVEIAEQRRIPMAFAFPYPYRPTREFPSFMVPWRGSLGGAYNLWTQKAVQKLSWKSYGVALNRWRAERFGLAPWPSFRAMVDSRRPYRTPTLYCYSPHVVPKPPDWEDTDQVTGFWLLDPPVNWTPAPALERFLASGPPPVYVGFGSMPLASAERCTRDVLRALEITGQRGLLLASGGGAMVRLPAPPSVMFVESIPFSWLLPRLAAVVHHGGAGTVASSLHAGIPSVVMPMALDQFAWARLIEVQGIGVRGARLEKLTAEGLASSINRVINDSALRSRAAAFGEKIRAERGVTNAVEAIERHALEFRAMETAMGRTGGPHRPGRLTS